MKMVRIDVKKDLYMQTNTLGNAKNIFAVIEQNRLYLRTWLPWVDDTKNIAVMEEVIKLWEKQYENGTDLVLGIYKNDCYIGNIGIHNIKKINHSGVIGYWLSEENQGQGIMSDCVRALMDYSFHSLSLEKIYIHCAEKNLKSNALPKRLGFTLEEVIKDGTCLYNIYFDLIIYAMTKKDWLTHNLQLVVPTLSHQQEAWDYRGEYFDFDEDHINGSGGLSRYDHYEPWLEKITAARTASQRNWVDCSTYFAFVDNKIVGTIQIRHCLNDSLFNAGGHIGYSVRPTQRRKGYATKMLSLALEKCYMLGIERVLITCDKGNIASMKTIMKHGGVFENEFIEENGNIIERYWILK